MAQFARPDADDTVGGWTDTPLYQKIDEASPNDSDFIEGDDTSHDCAISLSSVVDPESSSGHILRYRITRSATNKSMTCVIYLRQGTTTIASWTEVDPPGTWSTTERTLSAGEADSITDYSNLNVRMVITVDGGRIIRVSWVEFEVPADPAVNFLSTVTCVSAIASPEMTVVRLLASAINAVSVFSGIDLYIPSDTLTRYAWLPDGSLLIIPAEDVTSSTVWDLITTSEETGPFTLNFLSTANAVAALAAAELAVSRLLLSSTDSVSAVSGATLSILRSLLSTSNAQSVISSVDLDKTLNLISAVTGQSVLSNIDL
ncbi:hypothetical protein KAR91_60200, partial [Candidatus Pacearchaeota archaeon]|nr:hypothetical protein [Candidatus Pacearchaeota archaeon]